MKDTIAAIATPEGFGAISVIRLSGNQVSVTAQKIIRPLYKPFSKIKSHQATVANIVHPVTGDVLDETLVTFFKKPHSFTGEDVLEISCHGNPFITRAILEAILVTNVRLAEPGEFTRRAFENQRIDLSKAEAVAMMTTSESEIARKAALQILCGGLSEPVQKIRGYITEIRSAFELDLDFPEEDDHVPGYIITEHFHNAADALENLVNSGHLSDQYRVKNNVIIAGNVNAGKSTLFNQLTGRNRAIVSDEPGTTRDILEITAEWHGCTLSLVDTAGIRDSQSNAETEAVRRTSAALQQATLIIYVVDGSKPQTSHVKNITMHSSDTPILVFWNKTDLKKPDKSDVDKINDYKNVAGLILGSAKEGTGIKILRQEISSLVQKISNKGSESMIMVSTRQKSALDKAYELIREAKQLYQINTGTECIVPLLKEVDYLLGLILGDTVSPDVLSNIFSNFCIGK